MSYEITETLNNHPEKFTCMVSFNGKAPQYFEVEIPNDMGTREALSEEGSVLLDKKGRPILEKIQKPDLNAEYVDGMLRMAAAEDLRLNPATIAKKDKNKIKVVEGKIEVA